MSEESVALLSIASGYLCALAWLAVVLWFASALVLRASRPLWRPLVVGLRWRLSRPLFSVRGWLRPRVARVVASSPVLFERAARARWERSEKYSGLTNFEEWERDLAGLDAASRAALRREIERYRPSPALVRRARSLGGRSCASFKVRKGGAK